MPQLIGLSGGSQRQHGTQSQDSTTRPGGRERTAFDLLLNALTGQLVEPHQYSIPRPLGEAISGAEAMQQNLFADAFGPNAGLAGRLAGHGASGGPTSIGPPATRESLGLDTPTNAPPGFLPPAETVRQNLPPVRVAPVNQRTHRLQNRLAMLEGREADRQAIGKPTGRVERRIGRTKRRLGNIAAGQIPGQPGGA